MLGADGVLGTIVEGQGTVVGERETGDVAGEHETHLCVLDRAGAEDAVVDRASGGAEEVGAVLAQRVGGQGRGCRGSRRRDDEPRY